jgi:nucleoside phosphorylase
VDTKRREGFPKISYGTIGSANTLLKDPTYRDQLGSDHNILAIEMEGSGIADATWAGGSGYLLVRGICDYCDADKNDKWQCYAAVAAAAYARALVETLPPTRV